MAHCEKRKQLKVEAEACKITKVKSIENECGFWSILSNVQRINVLWAHAAMVVIVVRLATI